MRYLTFLFLLSWHTAVFGQPDFQWEFTNGPGVDAPVAIEVNSNGDLIAGLGRSLFRTSDHGSSWHVLPLPKNVGNILTLATMPNGKIIVSMEQAILRMEADGRGLKVISSIRPAWVVSDKTGILYAVKSDGSGILRSRTNGDVWETFAGPDGEQIHGFAFDEQGLYVTTGTGIYTSSDGQIWRRVLNGVITANYFAIAAGTNGHVWAVCYDGSSSGLFASMDHGKHWYRASSSLDFHYRLAVGTHDDVLGVGFYMRDSVVKSVPLIYGLNSFDSSGQWISIHTGGAPSIVKSAGEPTWNWDPLPIPLSTPSM